MEALRLHKDEWTKTSDQIFWGEIAPCDHVVQIYESDEVFLNLLTGFVHGGINADDAVIVIATDEHLVALKEQLVSKGCNVSHLISEGKFIPLDAEKTLARFMVNDWPDENLFNNVVSELLAKAKANGGHVRAFGEMVAILWAKGQVGATIRLEQLWNKFCETQAFCLFCAYPQGGFTQDAVESLAHICSAHSKLITGNKAEISYKNTPQKRVV